MPIQRFSKNERHTVRIIAGKNRTHFRGSTSSSTPGTAGFLHARKKREQCCRWNSVRDFTRQLGKGELGDSVHSCLDDRVGHCATIANSPLMVNSRSGKLASIAREARGVDTRVSTPTLPTPAAWKNQRERGRTNCYSHRVCRGRRQAALRSNKQLSLIEINLWVCDCDK